MVRKASQKAWSQIARVKEKEMKPTIMDAIEIEGMEAMVLSHRHLRQGVGRPEAVACRGLRNVNKMFWKPQDLQTGAVAIGAFGRSTRTETSIAGRGD
jgi:hypothetical protein